MTSIDCSEEQSDSENTVPCGKVKRQHMDHIAEKGYVGSFHNGLVHKPFSFQEVMKIQKSESQWVQKWNKVTTIPAWDVKKVRSKSDVIRQAKKNGKQFTSVI